MEVLTRQASRARPTPIQSVVLKCLGLDTLPIGYLGR